MSVQVVDAHQDEILHHQASLDGAFNEILIQPKLLQLDHVELLQEVVNNLLAL